MLFAELTTMTQKVTMCWKQRITSTVSGAWQNERARTHAQDKTMMKIRAVTLTIIAQVALANGEHAIGGSRTQQIEPSDATGMQRDIKQLFQHVVVM